MRNVPRRIVQVATVNSGAMEWWNVRFVAVADDGTLWLGNSDDRSPDWRQVRALPDREEPGDPDA